MSDITIGAAARTSVNSMREITEQMTRAQKRLATGNRVNSPVDGPAAYFSDLPIKAMLAALRDAGIPAEVSQTAGTYVCNHVFYGLMHALRDVTGVRGGFIHIPYSTEQAACHPGAASLPIATVSEGLRIALRVALTTTDDRRIAAGAEH